MEYVTKAADLAAIAPLCDAVIANHPLASNFASLWSYTAPDGANERLPEIILSAQFTADASTNGSNTQHLYYVSRYDDLPFMQRDLTGDRTYSRLGTTYYMYRVFDQINDSRFWKSFKTKNLLNKPSGTYAVGDVGVIYVINQPGDTRFSSYKILNTVPYSRTGRPIANVYVAYPAGATNDGALFADVRFPSLSKFIDASRTGGMNDVRGLRDITLARSAETYLFAAEAKIRLAALGTGSFADALPYINAVRARAQYQSGENRSVYTDGGAAPSSNGQVSSLNSFMPENSYYESNNIPVTTATTSLAVTSICSLTCK
jgi:hypothetical protein